MASSRSATRIAKVLAAVRRDLALDQVDLLVTEVDPGAREPEVRSVVAQDAAEDLGVERHTALDVRDVDRHVVDRERLHRAESPCTPPRTQAHAVVGPRCPGPPR